MSSLSTTKNKKNEIKKELSISDQSAGANSSVSSDQSNPEEKLKRFEGDGVVFKAKLIGSELVMEPRGDKMCQNSIQRLKAIIKGTNSHKKRIVLKISYDGVKVYDEKTNEILHHHKVPEISYIASDETDARTFGYVCDVPSNAHQFVCFKTTGPAVGVMSVLSALFDAVLEKNKQQSVNTSGASETTTEAKLIADDEGDAQFVNDKPVFSPSFVSSAPKVVLPRPNVTSLDRSADPIILYHKSGASLISDRNNIISGSAAKEPFLPPPPPPVATSAQSRGPGGILESQASRYLSSDSLDFLNDSGSSYQVGGPLNYLFMSSPPAMQVAGTDNSRGSASNASQRHQIGPIGMPPNSVLLRPGSTAMPASSLPRPSALAAHSHHNRSLVYNHSSASLGDVGRMSSVASSGVSGDSGVDRYAVFNDIDNLPSIFESATLDDKNNNNNNISAFSTGGDKTSAKSGSQADLFARLNPFDDDFFA